MKKISSVIWGIVLIAAGALFALNALNITDINIFFDGWWTLFIIVPCAVGLFTEREKTGENHLKSHDYNNGRYKKFPKHRKA